MPDSRVSASPCRRASAPAAGHVRYPYRQDIFPAAESGPAAAVQRAVESGPAAAVQAAVASAAAALAVQAAVASAAVALAVQAAVQAVRNPAGLSGAV